MRDSLLRISQSLEDIPNSIQVLPFGRHMTERGTFLVDELSVKEVIEDFDSRKNDIVIDYEHQTLSGSEAPAAGWVKGLFFRPPSYEGDPTGGIWAEVDWTERAKAYLRGREYRYLSPVFLKRHSDERVVRLINLALTNQPAIDGMVPVVNKSLGISAKEQKKEVSMMEKLCEALGLSPTSNEEEILSAVIALREEVSKKKAEELVTLAMKEGKITPAQREWALDYAVKDPEGFKVFVSKTPVIVPRGEVSNLLRAKKTNTEVDELQLSVNKMLGISDESFKKFLKEV